MITRRLIAALLMTTAATAGPAMAQTTAPAAAPATTAPATTVKLKVGDPAPALTVGKWIKGEPVKNFETGKIYVLEFWATWCGPCREMMPHLSELQKKHPDITFIGQNYGEDDEAAVPPFVKQMGDNMAYRVVLDDKTTIASGAMAAGWMDAAGKDSIPMSFLVGKDGKIAWIGHPGALEEVLDKVIAGTYDPVAAAAAEARFESLMNGITLAAKAKDIDGVLKLSKELATLRPEMADTASAFEFNLLAHNGRLDEARSRAEALAKASKSIPILNTVAWTIATLPTATPADLKIARQAVDRAGQLTGDKEPVIFDTSARLYAVDKDWTKAAEQEEKAVALAEGDDKTAMQNTLAAYKKQQLPAME